MGPSKYFFSVNFCSFSTVKGIELEPTYIDTIWMTLVYETKLYVYNITFASFFSLILKSYLNTKLLLIKPNTYKICVNEMPTPWKNKKPKTQDISLHSVIEMLTPWKNKKPCGDHLDRQEELRGEFTWEKLWSERKGQEIAETFAVGILFSLLPTISIIIQGCSTVLYSIWPRNHTSHKIFYFN